MKAEKDLVVSIDYILRNEKREVLDQSEKDEPLVYLHGHQNIIPGLEKELEGKVVGDKVNVVVPPSEGYGERVDELVQTISKEQFEEPETLQVGMQFQIETEEGPMIFMITNLDDQNAIIDGNHPLAGETLYFDVEVSHIRSASADEISHGHVHGEAGQTH